jgi:hypothetical protein
MGSEFFYSMQSMDRSYLALLFFAGCFVLACVLGMIRTVR